MKVVLEQKPQQDEIEVMILYARMSRTVKQLERLVRSFDKTVKCSKDGIDIWVPVSEIYYAESVDKRTFVYGERDVYQSELRLYQLLSELDDFGFVQVSKFCLLNLSVLEQVKTLRNSRLEAVLSNRERIYVTRKYISGIREKLKER